MNDLVVTIALSGQSFVFTEANTENAADIVAAMEENVACETRVVYDSTTYTGSIVNVGSELIVVMDTVVSLPSGMCFVINCEEDETTECVNTKINYSNDLKLRVVDDEGCDKGWTLLSEVQGNIEFPDTLCELYGVDEIPAGSLVASDYILTINPSDCSLKAILPSDIVCTSTEGGDESALASRVTALETKTSSLQTTVISLGSTVNTLSNSVDSVASVQEAMASTLEDIDTALSALESTVTGVNQEVTSLTSSVDTLSSTVTLQGTNISNLQTAVAANTTNIGNVTATADQNATDIDAAEANITTLQEAVAALQTGQEETTTATAFELTQWKAEPAESSLASGSSYNVFSGLIASDKTSVSVDTAGALTITDDGVQPYIQMNWQGVVEYLAITVSIGMQQSGALAFEFQLRRKVDDSLIRTYPLYINFNSATEGYVSAAVNILAYVANDQDPFITNGFYILLANISGNYVALQDTVNVIIKREYMTPIER